MTVPKDNVHPSPEIVKFDFRGDQLDAVLVNGKPFVSVRRVCEVLQVDNSNAQRRIAQAAWATMVKLTTVDARGRRREIACINARTLRMWLATIDAGRAKPELRAQIEAYQIECADAIEAHFAPAAAPPPPPRDHGPPHTGALLRHSRERVYVLNQARATAKAIGATIQRVLGELRREFHVPGYLDIPECSFDRLQRFLTRIERGEILLQRKRLPAPRDNGQSAFPFPPDEKH